MKAREQNLENLLGKKNKVFIVPPFQRRYAWNDTNFKRLFEDIEALLDGTSKRHFTGTLVF
jgi:uncharacterized protein with ParB-like and HNH nuclease domain